MKIRFSDGTTLDVLYVTYDNDLNAINIGIKTDLSYDYVKNIVFDKELMKTISVLDSNGNVTDTYSNFTTIKNMSVKVNVIAEENDFYIVAKYAGVESEVDDLKKSVEKLQSSISEISDITKNFETLEEQTNMLTECILEMSEIVYSGMF